MNFFVFDTVKFVSWIFLKVVYGLQVRGQENIPSNGPCIIASNHISYLDPVGVGVSAPRRVCFLARQSLFEKGLFGQLLHALGAVPLKREEADITAIRAAVKHLRKGEVVGLFPEGTRQRDGRLNEAKRGIGLLASVAKTSVVPVLVRGTYEALPPNTKSLRKSKIQVAFGPPIPYTEPSLQSRQVQGESASAQGSARHRYQALADAVTESWRRLEGVLNE